MIKNVKCRALKLIIVFSLMCNIITIMPIMPASAAETLVQNIFTDSVQNGYKYVTNGAYSETIDTNNFHTGTASWKITDPDNSTYGGAEIRLNAPIDLSTIRSSANIRLYVYLPQLRGLKIILTTKNANNSDVQKDYKFTDTLTSADCNQWKQITIPLNTIVGTDPSFLVNRVTAIGFQANPPIAGSFWLDDISVVNISTVAAPANLRLASKTQTTASIVWDAVNVANCKYNVFRNGTQVASNITDTSFNDSGLSSMTQYSYTIVAYDPATDTSSSPSSTLTVTTDSATGEFYYKSDFSQGTAGWTLGSGYTVSNGELTHDWTGIGEKLSSIYNGFTWSGRYTYSVDVKNEGGDTGNSALVVFNYRDSKNFYYVEVAGGKGNTVPINLKKYIAGTDTVLATYSNYPIFSSPANVAVTYDNGTITVVATKAGVSTTLFTANDSSITSGSIGVGLTYSAGSFKNIMAYTGKYAINSATYATGNNQVSVTANASVPGNFQLATLIAVAYDANRKIIAVDSKPYTVADLSSGKMNYTKTLNTNGTNVSKTKVILWDSLQGMKPLCEGKEATLN